MFCIFPCFYFIISWNGGCTIVIGITPITQYAPTTHSLISNLHYSFIILFCDVLPYFCMFRKTDCYMWLYDLKGIIITSPTRLPGLGDEKNMANYLLGFCREVSNLITFYRKFISLSSIIPVSYWLISLYRRFYALLIMILIRCHFFIFKFFKSENGFLKRKKFYTSNERFFFGKSVLRVHLDVRFFIILADICRW